MQAFYHQLNFSLINAARENLLNYTLARGSAEEDIDTYYQRIKKWEREIRALNGFEVSLFYSKANLIIYMLIFNLIRINNKNLNVWPRKS